MSNADLEHYFKALNGEKPPIFEQKPQCGFWKRRFTKNGPWVAAAIWRHPETGDLICRVGSDMVDVSEHWLSLARFPVAEADVRHYFIHGHWPGGEASEASASTQAVETVDPSIDPAVAIEQAATADGAPRPNDIDQSEFDKHKAAIDDALAGAEIWLRPDAKIADEKQANVIEAKINKFRELTSASTKMHKVEKEPHLTAGQAVDKKYNPDIKKMDAARTALLRLQTVWLTAQSAKAEAAQAATVDASDGDNGPPFEVQPVKTAGYSGKAIGLRDHTTAQIGDMAKAAKAILADAECGAELREVITKLTKRMLVAGKKVASAKLVTEKIAA